MSSASLIVPLALWSHLPNVQVTTVAYKDGHIVAGLKNGHIWIYRCQVNGEKSELELEHKILCIGHKSAVAALTIVESQTDGSVGNDHIVISASQDGEIIKWCLLDGQCLLSCSRGFDGIPKSLKPLAGSAQPAKFLLCSGFSNEIIILDCVTLEVVRVWAGHDDWETCTPFYDSDARQVRLLTANFNGKLRIWTFDELKKTIIKEYEYVGNLDMHGDKILELISNPYDVGVVLAVSRKIVFILTIRSDKVLNMQSITCPKENEIWIGGAFLSKTRALLWTKTGEAYLYLLPSHSDRKSQQEFGLGYHALVSRPNFNSSARRSSLPPNLRQGRPVLLESVHHHPDDSEIHTAITTVFMPTTLEENSNNWYLISFRNRSEGPTYAWKLLTMSQLEQYKETGVFEAKWSRENGEIKLVPIHLVFTQPIDFQDTQEIQTLSGHTGRVTFLYSPNMSIFGKKYLISGGEDCSVRIWSLENGKRLATFTVHSQPVRKILEPPADVGTRIRGCVISVGKDSSLAIISLEEMNCLYVFGGYLYPILGIQWRPTEDSVLISYGDETVHIWQLHSACLDRIVKGSAARDMISDKQWKISPINLTDPVKNTQHRNKTFNSFAIDSCENPNSPIHIFMINVRQLINDIYHYHVSALGSFSHNKTNGAPNELGGGIVNGCGSGVGVGISGSDDLDEKSSSTQQQSKVFSWTTSTNTMTTQLSDGTKSSNSLSGQPPQETEGGALGASVVQGLVSALMSWDINHSLDRICIQRLGLRKPADSITFGIRGANGNLSIAAPSKHRKLLWQISANMTATHLLSIIGLIRSFLSMKGLDKYANDIITHYGYSLPELVGKGFCHASLYLLSKFFQDSSADLQLAARTLFSSSLNIMRQEDLQAIIDFWKQFREHIVVPAVSSPDSCTNQFMARSTILLAMIGVDNPNALPKKIAKNVALSLTLLLNDESKLAYRLAALELCGRGFAAVLRTLFTFAIDADTNSAAIKTTARQAIFQIASINTPLFISTLTYDAIDSARPCDKNGYLKLVSLFIRKKPLILYSKLPALVEAVVKSLDPNITNLRETVLQTTTSILHDLVKTFPSITFHGRSQKLAVGTLEGASIIYDLRTATRWHVLEGHTKSVTAISFSGDGKVIVSCSLDERTVRVWNTSSGLLGMLSRDSKPFVSTLSSSIKPSRTFGFNIGDDVHLSTPTILDTVHFDWVSERTVKLYVQDLTMSFNV
ncbi:8778_t:CDS:10 [Ambispora gerdemannii]|uniref:8778_t:CDS:1 n=1 Tax=Ambispora gerdemannii TaxID=144530 RepID=A0A9N9C846_9GLOM|nr:8778_t:CDS:10 [Ambispora gerdemannii]